MCPGVEDTNDTKLGSHGTHSNDVDCTTTEIGHEEKPVAKAGEEGEAICPDAQGIGGFGTEANLLKEVGRSCYGQHVEIEFRMTWQPPGTKCSMDVPYAKQRPQTS